MGYKIKCLKCNDVIESTSRHDFVYCKCHSIAVDGGSDYCKITGASENYEILEDK